MSLLLQWAWLWFSENFCLTICGEQGSDSIGVKKFECLADEWYRIKRKVGIDELGERFSFNGIVRRNVIEAGIFFPDVCGPST